MRRKTPVNYSRQRYVWLCQLWTLMCHIILPKQITLFPCPNVWCKNKYEVNLWSNCAIHMFDCQTSWTCWHFRITDIGTKKIRWFSLRMNEMFSENSVNQQSDLMQAKLENSFNLHSTKNKQQILGSIHKARFIHEFIQIVTVPMN